MGQRDSGFDTGAVFVIWPVVLNNSFPRMESKAMNQVKIEKNVPIPQPTGIGAVMRRMNVGDSALFRENIGCVRSVAFQIFGPGKYVTRKDGDGLRVWRTK